MTTIGTTIGTTTGTTTTSYADAAAAAQESAWWAVVAAAMAAAAAAVYFESDTVAGHALRAQFAQRVATNPFQHAPQVAMSLAAQGVSAASTDDELEAAIASLWNMWAGA